MHLTPKVRLNKSSFIQDTRWISSLSPPVIRVVANKESSGPIGLNGDILTDSSEASFNTALLASQTAAYAAAQAVQAVATVAARTAGGGGGGGRRGFGRPTVAGGISGSGLGGSCAIGSRVVTAAQHAAQTASIAAKVVSAAVSSHGRPNIYMDQSVSSKGGCRPQFLLFELISFISVIQHHPGLLGKHPTRGIPSGLDLLIGDLDETLTGTNQDFLSAAAALEGVGRGGGISVAGDNAEADGDVTSACFYRLPAPRPLDYLAPSASNTATTSAALGPLVAFGGERGAFAKGGERVAGFVSMVTSGGVNTIWREPRTLVVTLFSALAHLSAVCPEVVVPLMDDLILILAYMLQDTTCHAKRAVSPSLFGHCLCFPLFNPQTR